MQAQPCLAGSGSFENTGNLPTIQSGHTATLLPTGKVLVTGGNYGPGLATAELYDPTTGTWAATGGLDAANAHSATLLPNGKVLVAGGLIFEDGQFLVVFMSHLYDPVTGTWTRYG